MNDFRTEIGEPGRTKLPSSLTGAWQTNKEKPPAVSDAQAILDSVRMINDKKGDSAPYLLQAIEALTRQPQPGQQSWIENPEAQKQYQVLIAQSHLENDLNYQMPFLPILRYLAHQYALIVRPDSNISSTQNPETVLDVATKLQQGMYIGHLLGPARWITEGDRPPSGTRGQLPGKTLENWASETQREKYRLLVGKSKSEFAASIETRRPWIPIMREMIKEF
jgi:hypothetical protein